MSDVNNIIDNIISDKKLLKSSAFRDKVYSDEPIIRTAAQLIKPKTPPEIKEMKDIAFSQAAYWKTSAWLFYTQGKFMESYTDSYSYNEDFIKYYPCYRELTVDQLRGYFTWRTQVRIGNTTKAPLPFVFIYIYELINCIGAETPEECFTLLRDFCRGYKDIDDTISRYVDNWLIDFIVYNELDTSLAKDIPEVIYEDYMLILLHWKRHNENEIFSAVSYLSTYQPEKSLFFISCQEDFKNVTVRCIVKLSEFFAEKRKSSLFSRLFGNISECS
ncbi:MAG: TerB N-terminal domain-containing protein, partial [Ruminococcus sp.]|uniref:TerB N-terminal domain-containing protein n=1 Tax=Ruminococcus sp. TaxID=41978 RepID=UPI001B011A3B